METRLRHKAFCESREAIENFPHACRPSTSVDDDNIEKVEEKSEGSKIKCLTIKLRTLRFYEYDIDIAQKSNEWRSKRKLEKKLLKALKVIPLYRIWM